ncbi:unnamed protein product [Tuber melanosporum]|uniref:(Perigord truffle) hypothetical protein n=1 Tax=Tuber melanosporum (strain Mel28) TaxID=656061 RepID=D5GKW3_TUBMM|nr:uncharacterized protein GSTUM_00009794001 [Tuber melanosporum]CAZ85156.1 unnamed protein product [Tuber melanosporum]
MCLVWLSSYLYEYSQSTNGKYACRQPSDCKATTSTVPVQLQPTNSSSRERNTMRHCGRLNKRKKIEKVT